jgi:hypothetical protein
MIQELQDLVELAKKLNDQELTERVKEVLMASLGTKLLPKEFKLQEFFDEWDSLSS